MMGNIINNISDALNLAEQELKKRADTLTMRDQVKVEQTASFENIRINGPKGTLFVSYLGGSHKPTDMRNNAVVTKRDMQIGVLAYVRYFDEGMKPADYVDFIYNALSGIEIENRRAEYERKLYPIDDKLIEEANGEWKYLIRIGVPTDFWEESIKQN